MQLGRLLTFRRNVEGKTRTPRLSLDYSEVTADESASTECESTHLLGGKSKENYQTREIDNTPTVASKRNFVTSLARLVFLLVVFSLGEHLCLRGTGVHGFSFCEHNATDIKLIENGYEKITIAIGDEVPENFELIGKMQELFTKTSGTLFKLTKNRAYFRHLEFVLPHTWGTIPPGLAGQLANNTAVSPRERALALFRLRRSHPRFEQESETSWRLGDKYAYVNKPYVIKTTPCGFAGLYLRLSPEFVLFGDKATAELGPPEKVLASEWAKLRWGVYDETPRSTAESDFYLGSNLETRPAICSGSLPGRFANMSDPTTNCSTEDSLYDPRCRFIPSQVNSTVSYASVLYRSNLSHISEFCDDREGTAQSILHDEEAPTTHNLHCKGKSVWSVLRQHPDFADGANPPMNVAKTSAVLEVGPPAPTFTIVQNLDRRVVLVLDVSTSMASYNKLHLMIQAASHYIDTVPVHTWVGIVCYAAKAQIKAKLVEIVRDDARNLLKERLSVLRTVAGTSLVNGIDLALEVLTTSGPELLRSQGGSLILLTDGLEHNRPKLNDTVMARLREFGVRVNTIALGLKVSKDLEWLATSTGGHSHTASSGEFGIDSELMEAFLSHHEVADSGSETLVSKQINIRRNSTKEESFYIDSSVGTNTRISIFYTYDTMPNVTLLSPNGLLINDSYSNEVIFLLDVKLKTITIRIPGAADVGEWKLYIQNAMASSRMPVRVNIVSYWSSEDPLVVSTALLCRAFNFTGTESTVIYAYVSKGELGVLDATVSAMVTRPLAESGIVDTRLITLRDNGLDPDVTKNDGVYSAYFISYTMQGRYNVKILASNKNGQAYTDNFYLLGIGSLEAPPVPVDTRYLLPTLSPSLTESPTRERQRRATRRERKTYLPSFQRVSSGGAAFNVIDWLVVDTCISGYTHFQDSCYRVVTSPQASYEDAESFCQLQGGQLAVLNSGQELSWLIARITPQNDPGAGNAWFGSIDQALRDSEDLDVKAIVRRVRRGMEDTDLEELASLFNETYLAGDLGYAADTFDPDLQGMSARDINRLIGKLGYKSRKDLLAQLRSYAYNLRKKQMEQNLQNRESSRRKRQLKPGSVDFQSFLAGGILPSLQPTFRPTDVITTTESTTTPEVVTTGSGQGQSDTGTAGPDTTASVTLSPAKREPEKPDPEISGAGVLTCSWFQDESLVQSNGPVCDTPRKFICERTVRDRFPPSRIVDLSGSINVKDKLLTLNWSAPGDDLDIGQAEGYDVRILRTRKAWRVLETNFDRGEIIGEDAIVRGNIRRPRSSGDKEALTVNLSQSSMCPPHGAIDLIFALPPEAFNVQVGNKPVVRATQGAKTTVMKFIRNVIKNFTIDEFEMQISAFVHTLNVPITDFKMTAAKFITKLATFTAIDSSDTTVKELIAAMNDKSGRVEAAKVLVAIADDNVEQFANIPDVTTILVLTSDKVNKSVLWASASHPGCVNSFQVPKLYEIANVTRGVQLKLCDARKPEYQVVGVAAFDDVGQRGAPSNLIPFVVDHRTKKVTCPAIEPVPDPQPIATSNTARTVGLAVGVPVALILSVLGTVMLLGQVKKWRKKKQEKKEKQMQQERLEKSRAARAAAAQATATPSVDTPHTNNNNNAVKIAWLSKNRTTPLWQPPV